LSSENVVAVPRRGWLTSMKDRKQDTISRLFRIYERTFADELNIRVERNTPSEWFKLLVYVLLSSRRIGKQLSLRATREIIKEGWTTAERMAKTTWEQRVEVLDRAHYVRYDYSTATYLGDTAKLLVERYKGDLRKLREAAERKPDQERRLLKEFKGIGDVGCDIFFREAQAVWSELFPFADKRALRAGEQLGLGKTPQELSKLVRRDQFVRLVGALARCDLERGYPEVML
jgi:endonuclease III